MCLSPHENWSLLSGIRVLLGIVTNDWQLEILALKRIDHEDDPEDESSNA
jgi:hypothetical protein